MILFKEDWKKYPSAIMDTSTTNKTWVRLAGLYKGMGVDNHGFLLALHNPELQGVDPYDPDLTQEQIIAISIECKENPWYFFREVLKVPTPGASENIKIRANRFNIAVWWLFFNHITSLSICSRQTGKSLAITSLDVYILGVAGISTDIHLLTKDDDLRMKTVAMVKEMLEELPWYLNLKSRKDTYNTEKLTIERLGNTYHTSVAQASPKAANNIGRGLTVAIHKIDEFAFIKNLEITLPALLASASAARESSKQHGSFYGNMFGTTAGYLSSPEGRFAYKIYKECARWSEFFYDTNSEEELNDIIKKNSPSGKVQVLCEFNHRMLGYTDEWLREKINAAMADGIRAEAEFLNIWAEGNESSPISKELLQVINNSVIADPRTTITTYGYMIRWYVSEVEIDNKLANRKLVMGLDTSDAVGNDDIGMVIRDVISGEVVAAGVYNETNLISFANWLTDFLVEYPNITLIIERRSSGVTIIDNLLLLLPAKGEDPFRRIFNWVTNDYDVNNIYKQIVDTPHHTRDPSIYSRYRKDFGYATAAVGRSSRDNLYGLAFNASVKYTGNTVRDKTLASQLNGLVRRNDRIDHAPGEHDDMCFTGNMLIRTEKGNIPIKELKLGDKVLTREGFKPVIAIYKRKANVITKFGITGTPEHPFITPNGITEFKNLTNNTEVYIWKNQQEKLLSIKAKDIIDILSQKEDTSESIIGDMINGKNNLKYKNKINKKEPRDYESRQLVYNITVADCHEYFVNDVLVHNCISWLLCYFLLTQGKNLSLYGINPTLVLTTVTSAIEEENGGKEAMVEKQRQSELVQQISKLGDELKVTPPGYKYDILVNKIKYLSKDINEDTKKSFNPEGLLKSIRESRVKSHYGNIRLI